MCETKTRKQYALEVSNHIAYEIKMFLFCILYIKQQDINLQNVFVESFALHFRNLYGFFTQEQNTRFNGADCNVFYSDIKEAPFSLIEDVQEEYNHACKKIMHLDNKREDLKTTGWHYFKLYNIFKFPIKCFIEDEEILPFISEKHLIDEISTYINTVDTIILGKEVDEMAAKGSTGSILSLFGNLQTPSSDANA